MQDKSSISENGQLAVTDETDSLFTAVVAGGGGKAGQAILTRPGQSPNALVKLLVTPAVKDAGLGVSPSPPLRSSSSTSIRAFGSLCACRAFHGDNLLTVHSIMAW